MAKRVEIKNLTWEQAEKLRSEYTRRGATAISITQQANNLYSFSFLPGDDPDFPTDDPPESSSPKR